MAVPKFFPPWPKSLFLAQKYHSVHAEDKAEISHLSSSDDDLSDSTSDRICLMCEQQHEHKPRQRTRRTFFILHTTLLLLNLFIAAAVIAPYISRTSFIPGSKFELDSLNSLIKYQPQRWGLTLGEYSQYTESPSPEVDAAWDKISASPGDVGFVIVQKDELDRKNLTSTPLADGSGYLATIDVFHEIHCLDFLRRTIYNDSYYHMDPMVLSLHNEHVAHCLDSLLHYIKCHADTSLIPFRWIRDYPAPWPDFRSTHQCRNFDDILEYAQKEQAGYDLKQEEQGAAMFIHPEMGVYEGKSAKNPLSQGKEIVYLDGPGN